MIRHDTAARPGSPSVAGLKEPLPPRPLNAAALLVLLGMTLLAVIGMVVALFNLPVITGCAFYGQCEFVPPTEAPSELGVSPVE